MADEKKKEIKKVPTFCAISFLNDFRLALARRPGDIGFRVKRNPHNVNLDQYGTKFVHSTVLFARSKWFKNQYLLYLDNNKVDVFENANKSLKEIKVEVKADLDENKIILTIDGIKLDSFQEFINFLYSAKANVNNDNFEDLLKLSKLFEMNSLDALLENYLIAKLKEKDDVRTALKYLELSDKNELNALKKNCYNSLRKNQHILIQTSAWNELLGKKPQLLLPVFDESLEEETITE